MTVLTGETGAGKTLLVEAISLLVGRSRGSRNGAGRADRPPSRPGSRTSASLAGAGRRRPVERVLSRVLPAVGAVAGLPGRPHGRGRPARGGGVGARRHSRPARPAVPVSPTAQRRALDVASGIDWTTVGGPRATEIRSPREELATLGGDARARAREMDLLRYQFDEIERAHLEDPDEDQKLREEEDDLADVAGARRSALAAWSGLSEDGRSHRRVGADRGGADRQIGARRTRSRGSPPPGRSWWTSRGRPGSLAEGLEDDPERLDAIQARRSHSWRAAPQVRGNPRRSDGIPGRPRETARGAGGTRDPSRGPGADRSQRPRSVTERRPTPFYELGPRRRPCWQET